MIWGYPYFGHLHMGIWLTRMGFFLGKHGVQTEIFYPLFRQEWGNLGVPGTGVVAFNWCHLTCKREDSHDESWTNAWKGGGFHIFIALGVAAGSKGESVTVIDRVIVFAEDYSVVEGRDGRARFQALPGSPLRCVSCESKWVHELKG